MGGGDLSFPPFLLLPYSEEAEKGARELSCRGYSLRCRFLGVVWIGETMTDSQETHALHTNLYHWVGGKRKLSHCMERRYFLKHESIKLVF